MPVHEAFRKYRVEVLNLSQEEAVKRLHMSQAALSLYETGKRQMTIETLQQFQKAYSIPADYLMNMLFGIETKQAYSPMVLREHSLESDLQRVNDMLMNNKKLLEFLVSLSYSSEKNQNDLADFLPHLAKFMKL